MYWLIKIHYKIAFYLYWSLRIQQPLESRASACSKLKKQYSCNLNNRHWNSHVIGWPLEYQTFHSTAGYMHMTAEKFEITPFIKTQPLEVWKRAAVCFLIISNFSFAKCMCCSEGGCLASLTRGHLWPVLGWDVALYVDCLIECPQWILNWMERVGMSK